MMEERDREKKWNRMLAIKPSLIHGPALGVIPSTDCISSVGENDELMIDWVSNVERDRQEPQNDIALKFDQIKMMQIKVKSVNKVHVSIILTSEHNVDRDSTI